VHAVDPDEPGTAYTALCGTVVAHVFPDNTWPPRTRSQTCPNCARLTA
jgi:hypothetical protein